MTDHPNAHGLLVEALVEAQFVILRLADLSPFIGALSSLACVRVVTPHEQFCDAGHEGLTMQDVCNKIVSIAMVHHSTTVIISTPDQSSDADLIRTALQQLED